jgi:hypothetical protein
VYRIYYQAKGFKEGKSVFAKVWHPDGHAELTEEFDQLGDGMYVLDYTIPSSGRYLWLIYEDGIPAVSRVFEFGSSVDPPGGLMSFRVEDGSGVKGATSYATVAFFKAYFADRNVDVSAITDEQIRGCLVAATDYIDTRWGPSFLGRRLWASLYSRSTFTLTEQLSPGDTITVNQMTYVAGTDFDIGDTLVETLRNVMKAVGDGDDEDIVISFLFPDPDVMSLVVFFTRDGIDTTNTGTGGAWDVTASEGQSAHGQPLEFPRDYLRDRDGEPVCGVPVKVMAATAEYAYRAHTAALAPDPVVQPGVTGVTQTVGPISTSTQYSSVRITKAYPAADRLLSEYMQTSSILRN